MTLAIAAGLLVGVGMWVCWTGLRPVPEPLGPALARFERRAVRTRKTSEDASEDRDLRLGAFMMRSVPPLERMIDRYQADLRIVGRGAEEQAARVGAYMLFALLLGPWMAFVFLILGVPLPIILPGMVALLGAAVGAVVPFASLAAEAKERRAAFAYALSSWCDVVVMNLASGRGVEQSMETAAASGSGWPFAELRGTLRGAYVRGDTPWEGLARLGADLGIAELDELASTVAMAGEEGAAVRETVAAKAHTIRQRITSDSEAAAAATTERMSLPSVLLVFGFLVFLGYPALAALFKS